jgi:hypothetical protein
MHSHAPSDYICPICQAIQGLENEATWIKQADIFYKDDLVMGFISLQKQSKAMQSHSKRLATATASRSFKTTNQPEINMHSIITSTSFPDLPAINSQPSFGRQRNQIPKVASNTRIGSEKLLPNNMKYKAILTPTSLLQFTPDHLVR